MPLSPPVPRALRHTRAIQVEAFARDDGLWDLDARISDIKERDIALASGVRVGGTPIHALSLRVTIDRELVIVDAEAASDAVPYPGHCDSFSHAYKGLIGLCLTKNFRLGLKEHLSGVLGCTHLTELAQILPTAAVGGAQPPGSPLSNQTLIRAQPNGSAQTLQQVKVST